MLDTMRNLVLLELNRRFGTHSPDLAQLRRDHGAEVASLLVVAAEKIPGVYLLQADQMRSRTARSAVRHSCGDLGLSDDACANRPTRFSTV